MSSAPLKRFYADVSLTETPTGTWQVLLDGKAAMTPARKPLAMPQHALAQQVAEEWAAQTDTIAKHCMPLTSLACVVIDTLPQQRAALVDELMDYAHTDQLCYREPRGTPWGETLHAAQQKHYAPVLAWLQQECGIGFVTTDGLMPIPQPQAALDACAARLQALDDWTLVAVRLVAGVAKSLGVALALAHGHLSTEQTIAIATLEETLQAAQWGMDDEQADRLARWQRELRAMGMALAILRRA